MLIISRIEQDGRECVGNRDSSETNRAGRGRDVSSTTLEVIVSTLHSSS